MHDREFELKPSKIYLAFSITILLISIGIAVCLPIDLMLKLFLLFLVVIYGVTILWQYGFLRSHQSILCIKRASDSKWLIQTRQKMYEGELCGHSTVTSWVSILRFYVPKHRRPKICVIFRDSLASDRYRQLVVVLRMF